MCTTFYFLCFTASLCSFVMFSRVFDFWYSIVLMSPRLSEYKHRDEPQQVHNHRHIFWLYRHSRWGVLILSARSMQSNGSLQRWAPITETQWTCSFESVKSIKSQMLTDAFTCKLNLCFSILSAWWAACFELAHLKWRLAHCSHAWFIISMYGTQDGRRSDTG